jgi:hypothetical protein
MVLEKILSNKVSNQRTIINGYQRETPLGRILKIMIILKGMMMLKRVIFFLIFCSLAACASVSDTYFDPNMDFGAIRKVAVMPFENLTNDKQASERVRDVTVTLILATEAVYVIPVGEVARGVERVNVANPSAPSTEEVIKLARIIEADAVLTGVVREYGEVRSGTTTANVVSMSLQMAETQTGKVVWSSSSTRGKISIFDRLFGGGGQPMNEITEKAVKRLLDKLFQ